VNESQSEESAGASGEVVAAVISDEAPVEVSPGIGGEVVAGVISAAITLGCILPPVVHLVLGPIGPGLGGFVAGNRVGPGVRGKVLIATITGAGVGGLLTTAVTVLFHFAKKSELPSILSDPGLVYGLAAGAAGYAAVVSFVGATIAGSMRDEKAKKAGG
jgi:hypothetical protein